MKIRDIMLSIAYVGSPQQTIREAAHPFLDHSPGEIPVLHANGSLAGIIGPTQLMSAIDQNADLDTNITGSILFQYRYLL